MSDANSRMLRLEETSRDIRDSAKTTPEPSARDTEPATRSPAQAAASEPPSGPAEPTEEVDGRAVSVKGDSGEGREADELPQLSQEGEKDLALKRALANDMKSRANAKYKEKQFELAIDLYTEAIDLTGNRNFVLFTNRAAGYYQLGRMEDCVNDCETALRLGQKHPELTDSNTMHRASLRKGNALMKLMQYAEARDAYNTALRHKFDSSEAEKKYQQANAALKRKAQQVDVQAKCDRLLEQADGCFAEGEFGNAAALYTQVLRKQPELGIAYGKRASCHMKLGTFLDALEDAGCCIRYGKREEKVEMYKIRARALMFLKEYEGAIEAYGKGLEIDPLDPDLVDGVRKCTMEMHALNIPPAPSHGDDDDDDDDELDKEYSAPYPVPPRTPLEPGRPPTSSGRVILPQPMLSRPPTAIVPGQMELIGDKERGAISRPPDFPQPMQMDID
ncbi:DNA binding protein, variant 2 [Cymbomonas tetramitiformis]|uniref:DNA binding protein, variant 2 n=1 Tax=Cymbomonas tetramitiformis TaxID=36881 RepID=A0AAE0FT28_9CHLO|nr:DNA binding protein, variant 2 [Cymbomonas tetramitiformis]